MVLEGVVQLHDPVRVGVRHDVPLLPEERRVRPLDHLVLGQALHRVHLLRALVPHQLHLPKGAPANHLDLAKVLRPQPQVPNVLGEGAI